MFLACLNLSSNNRSGTRGFFVGYSASGLPLYNLSTSSIHDASQSILRTARQEFKQIVDNPNSRKIFYFLVLNLGNKYGDLLTKWFESSLNFMQPFLLQSFAL